MEKILVSACLVGDKVRYDGTANPVAFIEKLQKFYEIVPFCPEVEGGLSTPRSPAEIRHNQVVTEDGKDVTANYDAGAQKALNICKFFGIRIAILKDGSPACGPRQIHDGSFKGNKIPGLGITARLLIENGIKVYAETDNLAFLWGEEIKTAIPQDHLKKKPYDRKQADHARRYGEKDDENGEKKPYERHGYGHKSYGEHGDHEGYGHKSYGEHKSYGHKPYGEGRSYGHKPYGEHQDYDRKPHGNYGDFGEKSSANPTAGEHKDYGHKPYGEHKDYGHKNYGDHSGYGHKSYGHKDYGHKPYGEHKDYDHKGYGEHKDFEHKPYGEHKDYDHKPYGEHKDYGHKSYGRKPYGEHKSYGHGGFKKGGFKKSYGHSGSFHHDDKKPSDK
jgi:uncharacterized protein YbbK (DUF523 family)